MGGYFLLEQVDDQTVLQYTACRGDDLFDSDKMDSTGLSSGVSF